MSLEAATFIHQLDSANPPGADPRAQGDDHIRLVKSTLQSTFPNVEGAVKGTGETVRSASPTLTGTVVANTIDASGDLQIDGVSVLRMHNGTGGTYSSSDADTGKVVDVTGNVTLGSQSAGTTIVLMNASAGSVTVSASSGTLKWWKGDGSAVATGARTLRRDGVCTVYKDAAGDWRIFGAGVA
jgi:hypothetical protein